ncbi:CDP-glycerol glycerophosphotransferase family protein [Clostridium perfringens]|uniref:CDP-glycerol glycerophosphotransferase family protein n=1 Tax=Clostridium perfringens TaxID=1502 RepID=UPI001EB2CC41|nr:CDP-glycerol glycerophosphotransferase family protein [Clostridium perfringens]EGT0697077.1 hypothetical protein [Clostridium perfringens]MDM1003077.1 CDP-glycerol glycerophosphotransferase family protein [Clostridium perfringens]
MNKIIFFSKNIILSIFAQTLSLFVKRRENYLAFGSWCGELYIDNSKYLFEYALNNLDNFKFVWIGNKELEKVIPKDDRIKIIEKDSLKSIYFLLKCKYMFCSQMHRADLCSYNVYRKSIIYSLDHGIPIKKWAQDAVDYNGEFDNINKFKKIYYDIIGENKKYSYFVTASELHDKANITALKYRGCCEQNNIHSGTPRNDLLYNYNESISKQMKKKYSSLLGFDESKKIIMYLPTYRRKADTIKSFVDIPFKYKEKLDKILEKNNAIIIEKNHFVTEKKGISNRESKSKNIIKLHQKVDLQEMLLFTDIQISDYSGCFLDFILLDRPVIHFAYDYETYKDFDSGLYYDIDDFAAGRITKNFEETLNEIELLLKGKDNYSDKRKYVKNKYMKYEIGKSSEQIINHMLKISSEGENE